MMEVIIDVYGKCPNTSSIMQLNHPQLWLFGHPALIDPQHCWKTYSICFIIPPKKSTGIVSRIYPEYYGSFQAISDPQYVISGPNYNMEKL